MQGSLVRLVGDSTECLTLIACCSSQQCNHLFWFILYFNLRTQWKRSYVHVDSEFRTQKIESKTQHEFKTTTFHFDKRNTKVSTVFTFSNLPIQAKYTSHDKLRTPFYQQKLGIRLQFFTNMDGKSENMERISENEVQDEDMDMAQLAIQLTKAIESLEKTINMHCNLLLRNSITQNQPRMRTNSVISTMENMIINDTTLGKSKDMKVSNRYILAVFTGCHKSSLQDQFYQNNNFRK